MNASLVSYPSHETAITPYRRAVLPSNLAAVPVRPAATLKSELIAADDSPIVPQVARRRPIADAQRLDIRVRGSPRACGLSGTHLGSARRLHPMHLHGHRFPVSEIDGSRFAGAVRDTVLVPPGRRVVVVFDANNPELCHHLYHLQAAGMFTTFNYV